MRIGASLFLIAVGAILRFAITANHRNTHGFDIGTAGIILMIVGAVGLIISVVLMSTRRRTDVIMQDPRTGTRGTTYIEPHNPADL
jgi:membrane-bound ClpP family serine protease